MSHKFIQFILLWIFPLCCFSQSQPGFDYQPLSSTEDMDALIVERADSLLMSYYDRLSEERESHWHRNFNTVSEFELSIQPLKEILRQRLGLGDQRVAPAMEMVYSENLLPYEIKTDQYTIQAVRWPVLNELNAEGLLIRPKGEAKASMIMLPDADIEPEVFAGIQKDPGTSGYGKAIQFVREGWEVLVPVLVNRADTFSGNPSLGRFTNQPHREWIYRQGYELGRHIIGYELQSIFAAVDWFSRQDSLQGKKKAIVISGYGEGGMLALFAAALETRFASCLVSGYFGDRKKMWREPIYRNIFGYAKYFGDAELAVMVWPRELVIEYSKPVISLSPPAARPGRSGAAPGKIEEAPYAEVKREYDKAVALLPSGKNHIVLISDGKKSWNEPFQVNSCRVLTSGLSTNFSGHFGGPVNPLNPVNWIDPVSRQGKIVKAMERTIQHLLDTCERTRNNNFWSKLSNKNIAEQKPVKDSLRQLFIKQIGALPQPEIPLNVKARIIEKTTKWTSYEVVLDAWKGVPAWGILTVPNVKLTRDQKLPVVVCQHGLEGLPKDVTTRDPASHGFKTYKAYAISLAEKGYVTFAPFNLYRGEDKFRVLQRKANPLGLTLFSVIIGQHKAIVKWLRSLPFVNENEIGFYGLSYGGKSAMRIPVVVDGYALSICSADFNEWVRKCASTELRFSYMFTGEYDMPEWDLGHTFNYAEMAALIAPRPFMVERGHFDAVSVDEWVGYEYEKVRRHYDLTGISENTRIEYFVGPHAIHGVGTFEFLDFHFMRKKD